MQYKCRVEVVRIEGIDCDNCAAKVKAALESVPGVERVDVRLDKGWAEVFVERDANPDDAVLTKRVMEAGYRVAGID